MVVCALAGIVLFGTTFRMTLDTLKIDSPIYQEIIDSKDLIADILPPPDYAIEAYLIVLQASSTKDANALRSFEDRFKQRHKEFEERIEFWKKRFETGAIRDTMLNEVRPPAVEFFDIAERQFFPAALALDQAKVQDAIGKLNAKYEVHRAAVNRLTALANGYYEQSTRNAEDISSNRLIVLWLISAAIMLAVAAFGFFITIAIVRPINGVRLIAGQAAEGDISHAVSVTTGDEIGEMSASFNAMMGRIRDVIARIGGTTVTLASHSEELSATSESMNQDVNQLSGQTDQVATAMTEVSQTTLDMARNAAAAAEASSTASSQAVKGKEIVAEAV
jgi:methyl-accepting chemotaxis protein